MIIDYCENKLFLIKSDNLNKLRYKNLILNYFFVLINCYKYLKFIYVKNY